MRDNLIIYLISVVVSVFILIGVIAYMVLCGKIPLIVLVIAIAIPMGLLVLWDVVWQESEG